LFTKAPESFDGKVSLFVLMNTFLGFEVVGSFRPGGCFFHLGKRLDPFFDRLET